MATDASSLLLAVSADEEVAMVQSDREAGFALAGFLLSLAAFTAALLGLVFAFGVGPDWGIGGGIVLIAAVIPVASVGYILAAWGRSSMSRRGLAIAGMVLGALVMVFFFVLMARLFYGLFVLCPHFCA
jgi:hypothetical protein